jgi:L-ribulose-5-phosphate 4-epimerase
MSLDGLREQVAEANRALAAADLVVMAFGNASGVDRDRGVLVIKPSGIPCDRIRPEDAVVVALADGTVVEGDLRPSSDTPTHRALYRRFPTIGGIVHTHSPYATAWAQSGRSIPCFGTTHADHFAGSVPVTRSLRPEEILGDYEAETGEVIVETMDRLQLDPLAMPAALVVSHGPFTWGTDPADAVANAVALETVAAMASRTLALAPAADPISGELETRHFSRKHGPDAYYGQPQRGPVPKA